MRGGAISWRDGEREVGGMKRVGEVACFGTLGLLAEVVGGFLFGFCESGRDGFGFGLE